MRAQIDDVVARVRVLDAEWIADPTAVVESAAIARTISRTTAATIIVFSQRFSFGKALGVVDVVGRLPYTALSLVQWVARPVVEALAVELFLAGVVTPDQVRSPVPGQIKGVRGALRRSPGLLRSVPDLSQGEHLRRVGLEVNSEVLRTVNPGTGGALPAAPGRLCKTP